MKRPWQHAVGEVVLIFLGITAALFFENWNEERHERRQEHEVLTQMLADLIEMKGDLTNTEFVNLGTPVGDLPALEAQDAAHRRIVEDFLESPGGDPDSIARDLGIVVFGSGVLFAQRGAYESLTATGVDLIEDESLRVAIVRFFESTLGRVEHAQTVRRERVDGVLTPYVAERFETRGLLESSVGYVTPGLYPREVQEVREDPEFEFLLVRMQLDRSELLRIYRMADSELDELIDRVSEVVSP